MPSPLRHRASALALAAAFAALALGALAAPPSAAAPDKVVFFTRTLNFGGAATPGFDFGILYGDVSYRDVEVRLAGMRNCASLTGALQVTTVPPVPIPDNGVFLLTFGCGGLQSYLAASRPGVAPAQGRDYPFSLEWAGAGRGNVTFELAGTPWKFP